MESQGNANDVDGQNDTGWSLSSTSTGTLALPPPPQSLSSSSNHPEDDFLLQMSPPLPTLPFELITEILCRIPVNFLMTLKCVCKPWNSLISSDRKFARKHLRISRMNPKLILNLTHSSDFSHVVYPLCYFFTNDNGTIEGGSHINCPLYTQEKETSIVGSCDGILCLITQIKLPIMSENFIQPALWNPSTRKCNLIPTCYIPQENHDMNGYVHTVYGFGYDHFTDKYKVVAVFIYIRKDDSGRYAVYKTQVMVHTLGTHSWRLIRDFPSLIFGSGHLQSGKFVSGTINWLAVPSDSNTLLPIVSLDLGTESYQEILHPDYGAEMITFTLGVSRDCLCILAKREIQMVSDIWLMKEYGKRESWTKLVSVPYMGYTDHYPCINQALYISEDDQVLLEFVNVLQLKLVVYDPINITLKIHDIENCNNLRLPEIYTESLISPCS